MFIINCNLQMRKIMMTNDQLLLRAKELKLYGLVSNWDSLKSTVGIEELLRWEEDERNCRGVSRRLTCAKIERFKPLAEFDWKWPKKCDRLAVEELMQL